MMGAQSLLLNASTPAPVSTHYLKLLQVFEPRDLNAEIQACHQYGYTGLLIKALDGSDWMSRFDSSQDALHNLAQVAYQVDRAHMAGLYCFVWTVPQQADWEVQAAISAAMSKVADGLFLDVEPYSQFWGAWAQPGLASQFMTRIRESAPDAFIVLQPDPRPTHLAEIRTGEWMPGCDAIAGQHYWTDFGTDPSAELDHATALGLLYDAAVLPTLPGNAPLSSFPREYISGFPGFVVWRWGTTPPATIAMLGGLSVAGLQTGRIDVL
jgi:hypothetical protein